MRKLVFYIASAFLWAMLVVPVCAQGDSGANASGGQRGTSQMQTGTSGQAGSMQSGTAGQAGKMQTGTSGQAGNMQSGSAGQMGTVARGTADGQTMGGQAGANFRAGQQQQTGQQMIDSRDRQFQSQQQLNTQQFDRDNRNRIGTGTGTDRSNQFNQFNQFDNNRLNDNRFSNRTFRFDDHPEFRGGLRVRNFPFDDWRIVFNGGRYWYWTPNNSWVYWNNGNWIDFTPGIGVGIASNLFPVGFPNDDWRIVVHNGRRWYWAPNQVWLYYNNGNWLTYDPNVVSTTGAVVFYPPGYPQEDWRIVVDNGRRWYWTPNRTWLLFENNSWRPFSGDRLSQRQAVGYRGIDNQQIDNRATDRLLTDPQQIEQRQLNRPQLGRPEGNMTQPGQPGRQTGQGGNVMPPPTPPTPRGDNQTAGGGTQTPGGNTQGNMPTGNTPTGTTVDR